MTAIAALKKRSKRLLAGVTVLLALCAALTWPLVHFQVLAARLDAQVVVAIQEALGDGYVPDRKTWEPLLRDADAIASLCERSPRLVRVLRLWHRASLELLKWKRSRGMLPPEALALVEFERWFDDATDAQVCGADAIFETPVTVEATIAVGRDPRDAEPHLRLALELAEAWAARGRTLPSVSGMAAHELWRLYHNHCPSGELRCSDLAALGPLVETRLVASIESGETNPYFAMFAATSAADCENFGDDRQLLAAFYREACPDERLRCDRLPTLEKALAEAEVARKECEKRRDAAKPS